MLTKGNHMLPRICRYFAISAAMSLTGVGASVAQEMKFGAIASLEGPAAFVGVAAKTGIEVAVQMINSDPVTYLGNKDRKIAVSVRAGGLSPATALSEARVLQSDPKVLGLFGPTLSPQALALGPFAQQSRIPLLVMHSPALERTEAGDYVFGVAQDGNNLSASAVKAYLKKHPNTKTAGVIYNHDNQGNILTAKAAMEAFKEARVQVTEFTVPFSSMDFAGATDKLKAAKAEVVYLSLPGSAIIAAVQQADRVGYRPVYLGQGPMASSTVLQNAGKSLNGSLAAADYDPNLDTPLNKTFVAAFTKAAGNPPDIYGAQGFATTMLAATAIKSISGDVTREKLKDALARINNVPSVLGSGSFTFRKDRTVAPPPAVLEIQDGKVTSLKP